jgi:hypothetical protein
MRVWIIVASVLLVMVAAWLALAFESGTFIPDDARYAFEPSSPQMLWRHKRN